MKSHRFSTQWRGALRICCAMALLGSANGGELIFSQFTDNQSTSGPSLVSPDTARNSEVADDFDVVADIERVRATGFIWGTVNFRGVHVRFYEFGADNRPAALQREYFAAASDSNVVFDAYGNIDVKLSPPFSANGKHFLSVQPVSDYWYWWSANSGAARGESYYFRDSNSGETWHHSDNQPFSNTNADVAFLLYGTVTGPGRIDRLSTNTLARGGYLEIFGANFGGSGTVVIGEVAAPIADWTSTRIVAYVPEASPLGAVNVQVVTAGASNSKTLSVTERQPNGRVNWRLRMEGAYSTVRPARGPDGTIYAIDVGFRLYAISPDGGVKWIVRGAGNKGVAVGPDGTIYAASEDYISAYNPDGRAKWSFKQNPRSFICLGVTVGPDGNIYSVGTEGPGVFSLTPAGSLRWTNPEFYDRAIVDYGEIVIGPNNGKDQLYFYANNHTRAIRLEDGASIFTIGPTGQPVVSPLDGTVHTAASAYDPSGSLRWSFTFPISGLPVSAPDLASDGTHYTTYRLSELYALDPNGREKWHTGFNNYIGPPNVDPVNSLVVIGSAGTLDTEGFVLGVSTSTRKEIWRVQLPKEEAAVYNPWTSLYGFNQFVDTRAKFSADGSAVYLITAIATGGLVRDRCFLYSINTGVTNQVPASTTQRSVDIKLSARLQKNNAATVNGVVSVRDASGASVSGATVAANWNLPTGAVATQTANTDSTGNATFSIKSIGGTYTLTVTDLTRAGLTFDKANSVLSRSLTTATRLNLRPGNQNLVLSWVTNVDGLTLLSAGAAESRVWSAVPQSPQVTGENYTVTVPIKGNATLFRLVPP